VPRNDANVGIGALVLIIVPDVNVLVSRANADKAGRSSTISQKVVRLIVSGSINGDPAQLAMSFKMLDTYREVLLRKGYDRAAVEESVDGLVKIMKYGPIGFDPHIVLGGTPDPSLKDTEDGDVLATAYAAHANILITDNLKDFSDQDSETFATSRGRTSDGAVGELYCLLRTRPNARELVVLHPADFVMLTERGLKITPASIRQTFATRPQAGT
jgi:predicted nucleic acid-binding protein